MESIKETGKKFMEYTGQEPTTKETGKELSRKSETNCKENEKEFMKETWKEPTEEIGNEKKAIMQEIGSGIRRNWEHFQFFFTKFLPILSKFLGLTNFMALGLISIVIRQIKYFLSAMGLNRHLTISRLQYHNSNRWATEWTDRLESKVLHPSLTKNLHI